MLGTPSSFKSVKATAYQSSGFVCIRNEFTRNTKTNLRYPEFLLSVPQDLENAVLVLPMFGRHSPTRCKARRVPLVVRINSHNGIRHTLEIREQAASSPQYHFLFRDRVPILPL